MDQPVRTDIYAICPCGQGMVFNDGELHCPKENKRTCELVECMVDCRVHCLRATNGDIIVVDHEDKQLVDQYSWSKHRDGHYRTTDFDGQHLYIHRLCMGPDTEGLVDHINRQKWDNRKCNLRIADARRNRHNVEARPGSKSRFVGVDYFKSRWRARIQGKGVTKFLGYFETEEEAAKAVNEARKELYGDHAYLNEV